MRNPRQSLFPEILPISPNDFFTREYLDLYSQCNFKLTVIHLPLAIIAVLVHELQQSLVLCSCKVLNIHSKRLLCEILIGLRSQLRRETLLIGGGHRDVHLVGLLLALLLIAPLGGDRLLPVLERFLAFLTFAARSFLLMSLDFLPSD